MSLDLRRLMHQTLMWRKENLLSSLFEEPPEIHKDDILLFLEMKEELRHAQRGLSQSHLSHATSMSRIESSSVLQERVPGSDMSRVLIVNSTEEFFNILSPGSVDVLAVDDLPLPAARSLVKAFNQLIDTQRESTDDSNFHFTGNKESGALKSALKDALKRGFGDCVENGTFLSSSVDYHRRILAVGSTSESSPSAEFDSDSPDSRMSSISGDQFGKEKNYPFSRIVMRLLHPDAAHISELIRVFVSSFNNLKLSSLFESMPDQDTLDDMDLVEYHRERRRNSGDQDLESIENIVSRASFMEHIDGIDDTDEESEVSEEVASSSFTNDSQIVGNGFLDNKSNGTSSLRPSGVTTTVSTTTTSVVDAHPSSRHSDLAVLPLESPNYPSSTRIVSNVSLSISVPPTPNLRAVGGVESSLSSLVSGSVNKTPSLNSIAPRFSSTPSLNGSTALTPVSLEFSLSSPPPARNIVPLGSEGNNNNNNNNNSTPTTLTPAATTTVLSSINLTSGMSTEQLTTSDMSQATSVTTVQPEAMKSILDSTTPRHRRFLMSASSPSTSAFTPSSILSSTTVAAAVQPPGTVTSPQPLYVSGGEQEGFSSVITNGTSTQNNPSLTPAEVLRTHSSPLATGSVTPSSSLLKPVSSMKRLSSIFRKKSSVSNSPLPNPRSPTVSNNNNNNANSGSVEGNVAPVPQSVSTNSLRSDGTLTPDIHFAKSNALPEPVVSVEEMKRRLRHGDPRVPSSDYPTNRFHAFMTRLMEAVSQNPLFQADAVVSRPNTFSLSPSSGYSTALLVGDNSSTDLVKIGSEFEGTFDTEFVRNLPHLDLSSLPDDFESLVSCKLYPLIFAPLPQYRKKDKLLHRRLLSLSFVTPAHLDLPVVPRHGPAGWRLAQACLLSMDAARSPAGKLRCLLNCCKVITVLLGLALGINSKSGDADNAFRGVGADDFLPGLIYTVIKAAPRTLYSTIKFIQDFRSPSKLLSEEGYFLTNLVSVVAFIRYVQPKQLNLSAREFKFAVERCRSEARCRVQYLRHFGVNTGLYRNFENLHPMNALKEIRAKWEEALKDVSGDVNLGTVPLPNAASGVEINSTTSGPLRQALNNALSLAARAGYPIECIWSPSGESFINQRSKLSESRCNKADVTRLFELIAKMGVGEEALISSGLAVRALPTHVVSSVFHKICESFDSPDEADSFISSLVPFSSFFNTNKRSSAGWDVSEGVEERKEDSKQRIMLRQLAFVPTFLAAPLSDAERAKMLMGSMTGLSMPSSTNLNTNDVASVSLTRDRSTVLPKSMSSFSLDAEEKLPTLSKSMSLSRVSNRPIVDSDSDSNESDGEDHHDMGVRYSKDNTGSAYSGNQSCASECTKSIDNSVRRSFDSHVKTNENSCSTFATADNNPLLNSESSSERGANKIEAISTSSVVVYSVPTRLKTDKSSNKLIMARLCPVHTPIDRLQLAFARIEHSLAHVARYHSSAELLKEHSFSSASSADFSSFESVVSESPLTSYSGEKSSNAGYLGNELRTVVCSCKPPPSDYVKAFSKVLREEGALDYDPRFKKLVDIHKQLVDLIGLNEH